MLDMPEQDDPVDIFVYDCVRVERLTRDNVITAIIRDRYTIDKVEAIQNNFLKGDNVIEFLKLQLYREFAKLIADSADQALIEEVKQRKVYAVQLPLNLTLPGGDYNALAQRMQIVRVPYLVEQENNQVTVYPGWISDEDRAILEADNRVTITEIKLFQE